MKKESVPRDRAAEQLEQYEHQSALWQKISRFSHDIRDTARSLYSFNNPFVEKTVTSSNSDALTATASRDTQEQTFNISIKNIATADSFLSGKIPSDYKIPKGVYTFSVGEKHFSLNWNGGRYKNFIQQVNKRGNNILHISEIKTTGDDYSLLIESKITGAAHRLSFADDALNFALENRIIKENDGKALAISVPKKPISPMGHTRIAFAYPVQARQQYTLEYTVQIEEKYPYNEPPPEKKNNQPDAHISKEKIGSVTYKGIRINNEPSMTDIPNIEIPQAQKPQPQKLAQQKVSEDYNTFSLISKTGSLIPLPLLENTSEPQTFSIPLDQYGDIQGIAVHNNNTHKTLTIDSILISDPHATGDYVPVHPVSQAQDAAFQFEGITIKRDSNDISDLIPGVTLHLTGKTTKKETISIKPDTEAAKNAIIEMVVQYNRLLTEINIATSNQPAVIEEIEYFTDEERKAAKENLGSLFGDSTLSSFKNKLRRIVTNVYRRNDSTSIRSLAEMGISTKSDTGAGINNAQLRGYLEINEKKLDDALANSMPDIRYLFGYDTNNDRLADNGVGVQLFNQINPYTERGGIFPNKTNALAARIRLTNDRIERYDKQLERKEAALQQKYGAMEGTLQRLQRQSGAIKNLNQQNKNQ